MKIIPKLHNWNYHCTGALLGLNKVDSRGIGSRHFVFITERKMVHSRDI